MSGAILSAADESALRRLLGQPEPSPEAGAGVTILRSMHVYGSSGYYAVEERIDHVKGGTYVFCPCPGWKFQMAKGAYCRHATEAARQWAGTDGQAGDLPCDDCGAAPGERCNIEVEH